MEINKCAFIGLGAMGNAMLRRLLQTKSLAGKKLIAFERNTKRKEAMGQITFASEIDEIVDADLFLIAVKPKDMQPLLSSIEPKIKSTAIVISVASGITIETMAKWLHHKGKIFRGMPNTAVAVGQGVVPLCSSKEITEEEKKCVQMFFSPMGYIPFIPEKLFDAVAAISGSGPAYFFYLTEALTKAAIEQGFSQELAEELAKKTAIGAAALINDSFKQPQELRQEVTSPGGSTAEAIAIFEKKGLEKIVSQAIDAAIKKNKELGAQ